MASLNLSTNGPSITKSYQSVVNAPAANTGAAASPTYGQWAVFSVSTPLVNAFQPDAGNKESVLKVQSSDEGELADLIEDFSEGKIQFAFVKVKDPNTGLGKNVLIAWCGEGVPERTKGYFNSHMAAVSKFLQGYHVQITARSDRDLTPEGILQKVSDASGAKYSSASIPTPSEPVKPPVVATKPVFTASRTGGVAPPPGGRRLAPIAKAPVDDDGWGADAPPVTRTELEKVPSAYKPTKVDIHQLTSQKQPESRFTPAPAEDRSDVVKGGYQPIGKVDIAAIRRQARESGQNVHDRPEPVKGAYEPVGKVDIAAIRAKAQPAQERSVPEPQPSEPEPSKSVSERSAPFQSSERLTSLPKPKVANRFGGASNFAGTKAPLPSEFGIKSTSAAAPIASTSRTFADQGGKTPAQLWAERKAKERGGTPVSTPPSTQPVSKQVSGDGEWKSSYTGKTWAPVQTTHTGRSAGSDTVRQESGYDGAAPSEPRAIVPEEVPPPLDHSNKPNAGHKIPLPGLPTAPEPTAAEEEEEEEEYKQNVPTPPPQPRSPTPPTPAEREPSPIQVALPVSRNAPETLVQDAHEEVDAPPQPLPIRSLEQVVPHEDELEEPSQETGRAVAETSAHVAAAPQSIRAVVQYDYEKAEDNEIELKEGEYVTDIEMVDPDWWLGVNVHGERGLFPSNYVEVVEQESEVAQHEASQAYEEPAPAEPEVSHGEVSHEAEVSHAVGSGHTATALYDYEAAEDNELSFPDGAKIENIEFPDEDWWSGEYGGKVGLFPANYVELDQ
ncbi:hypothetical protein UA08_06268 [Talaromyces atroroseus]|uniref:Drebrin-like protein n=1 Tax=Talaromyces atroroseus TaxID=1441469 RepID=A0A225AML5_TALAT|nr:hypothetical protein UA08_06268 [Talaromyces atroroseus]OKL58508.1 hypothetical protein UA08_06268 [Talaromyces atroroseus]